MKTRIPKAENKQFKASTSRDGMTNSRNKWPHLRGNIRYYLNHCIVGHSSTLSTIWVANLHGNLPTTQFFQGRFLSWIDATQSVNLYA
jgi:hypothetical protein